MTAVYEEVIDFLAAGPTSEELAEFQASDETKARVADLIRRQKTTGLTETETADLNTFLQLEHVMRLAKAKARQRLAGG
jgi:hypothetical protein